MKTSIHWAVRHKVGAAVIVIFTLIAPSLSCAQDIKTGLVSYWPLDEIQGGKSPDLFGTFDMTATNLTADSVVEGRVGNAIQFDSTLPGILERTHDEGEALPLDQYENWTIAMWVKGDGTDQPGSLPSANDRRIFSEGSTQNNGPLFNLGTSNNGDDQTLDLFVRGDNGSVSHARSEAMPFDGNWHHIVYVQTDNTFTAYVDGEKTNILAGGEPIEESVRPMVNEGAAYRINTTTIGGIRRASSSHFFNGLIDEVGAWNRALTDDDVAEVFNNGFSSLVDSRLNGLVAYWPLDEIDAGGKSPDVIGTFDMTATNLSAEDIVEGKIGRAVLFDSALPGILERTHDEGEALPLDQYEDWTVAMWVKGDGTDQPGNLPGPNDRRIFSEGSTQNNGPLFNLGTSNNGDDQTLDLFVRGDNGSVNHARSEAMPFDGEWHHLVYVQTGNSFTAYVDGEETPILAEGEPIEESVRPIVNEGAAYRINTTTIGGIRRASSSHFFNGLIDEVGAWNRALTAEEVTSVFETGVVPPSDPLLSDLVSHWPMDEIDAGGKSPDAFGTFDMTATNLTGDSVVEGRVGNAIQFDSSLPGILERTHDEGEALPLDQYEDWTVAMWVKGDGTDQPGNLPGPNDRRIFSEGSTQNNGPLFNLGTSNNGDDQTLDLFVRGDNGSVNHARSEAMPFDGEWHHLVYVQTGNTFTAYVDGEETPILAGGEPIEESVRPMVNEGAAYRINTTTIGGIRRASSSHFFNGLIDEVGAWSRALSAEEAMRVFTEGIPEEEVVGDLFIRSFAAERSVVAKGEVAILRWEGTKDNVTWEIDQGIGNVDDKVVAPGNGLVEIPISADVEFTLTAKRGEELVTKSVSVTALEGVNPGWYLLGNVEEFEPGLVVENAIPFWFNPDGTPRWNISEFEGNKVFSVDPGQGQLFAELTSFAVADGEGKTLFFRMYMDGTDFGLHYHIGMTNKGLRGFDTDTDAGLGAFIVLRREEGTNEGFIESGTGETSDFVIRSETWYNVWLDITNGQGEDPDSISAYIAEDGEERTTLFENSEGDEWVNVVPLTFALFAAKGENTAENGLLIDDIFVSRMGFLDTAPLGSGVVALQITNIVRDPANGNILLEWNGREGRNYIIEGSTDLEEWLELDDGVEGVEFTDPTAGEVPERYYRVGEG